MAAGSPEIEAREPKLGEQRERDKVKTSRRMLPGVAVTALLLAGCQATPEPRHLGVHRLIWRPAESGSWFG
jgi:hypothetical protein